MRYQEQASRAACKLAAYIHATDLRRAASLLGTMACRSTGAEAPCASPQYCLQLLAVQHFVVVMAVGSAISSSKSEGMLLSAM